MSYTLYYKMNPEHTDGDEYFYEDIHTTMDNNSLANMQLATVAWKEDSNGIRVIKDRFGGCISRLETEDELKEFMWIKLKSQKLI
jgi:hypothetical protein